MNRQLWDDLTLSAYVDGQLNSEDQHALEADMARDATLRRQVQEIQLVVTALREAPLREPPRNFLLTPTMVDAPQKSAKAPQVRRTSLLFTRWATALSAIAFVVALTFQLRLGTLIPLGTTPPMAPMMEDTAHLERNFTFAPDELPPEDGTAEAVVAPLTVLEAAPPATTEDKFCSADEICEEPAPVGITSTPILDSGESEGTFPPPLPEIEGEVPTGSPAAAPPQLSLALALALLTVLLAGVSWWLSHRQ